MGSRWKMFGLILVGGMLGLSAGFMLGVFFYPFIFLADITAMEQVAGRDAKTVVARAQFIHANPSDPVHFGKGGATLFADLVHLEADFEVGPGPRFHVYLSPKAGIMRSSYFEESRSLDLGRLKAFKGSQNFPVPPGTDLGRFKSLVIWCKQFGVLFAAADMVAGQ